MKIDIITIFPEIFDFYFKQSILNKAVNKKLFKIKVHNLRDFTKDKHKSVDDKPFGGDRGMIIKIEPIYKAVKKIKKGKIILFTPRGKKFNQKMANRLSKAKHLILISGRYEGVDERVAKHIADEQISIGNYVLMGGDLPCLVFIETIARLIPGVVGKSDLLKKRITKQGFIEYPQYTRPEIFKKWKVPKVLLSGNHKEIEKWRRKHSKVIE